MKQLLTFMMLLFGIAAFAADGNGNPITEKNSESSLQEIKKTVVKPLEDKDDKVKDRQKVKVTYAAKRTACSTCTGIDPRFDIGGYFAEFINRNNLKLVKLLTE